MPTKSRAYLICSWTLEIVLYVTATSFLAGHLVNWLTSPKPLNPLWRQISEYAASTHGGQLIETTITLYAVSMFLYGVINVIRLRSNLISWVGGIFMAIGSVPMLLVARFRTFTPFETNMGWIETLKYKISCCFWGLHSAGENISNDNHNKSIFAAAILFSVSLLLISISFLGSKKLNVLGKVGITIVPFFVGCYYLTSVGSFFPGLWQRLAFLMPFLWMLFATRSLRKDFAVENHASIPEDAPAPFVIPRNTGITS